MLRRLLIGVVLASSCSVSAHLACDTVSFNYLLRSFCSSTVGERKKVPVLDCCLRVAGEGFIAGYREWVVSKVSLKEALLPWSPASPPIL